MCALVANVPAPISELCHWGQVWKKQVICVEIYYWLLDDRDFRIEFIYVLYITAFYVQSKNFDFGLYIVEFL